MEYLMLFLTFSAIGALLGLCSLLFKGESLMFFLVFFLIASNLIYLIEASIVDGLDALSSMIYVGSVFIWNAPFNIVVSLPIFFLIRCMANLKC